MDCYELFEDIIKIEAYPADGITFNFPDTLAPRNLTPADFVADPAKAINIPFDENNLPSLTEKNKSSRGGDYRTVSLTWRNNEPSPESIALLEQLRYPNHHFIITRLDGRRYLMRSNELTYEMNYNFDGSWLTAGVDIQSETGLQFILS